MAAGAPQCTQELSLERQSGGADRRIHMRFPISVPVRYLLADHEGVTMTHDMSSDGIFMNTSEILPAGKLVKLFVDWPAMLDQHCLLRLVVVGKILRSSPQGTAVGISKYEFRVRSRYPLSLGMTS